MNARDLISSLDLKPHPEGGWYREVYRPVETDGTRGAITSIYFLLSAGDRSHWHRLHDADEVWNYHAGAPLLLEQAKPGGPVVETILGTDIWAGEQPQCTIPAGVWQAAKSLGDWTLVGCAVGPAFQFSDFELAPPDWHPEDDQTC